MGMEFDEIQNTSDFENSDFETDHEESYEVEKIIDWTVVGSEVRYYVKWKGWDESYNTWQSEQDFNDGGEMVHSFRERTGKDDHYLRKGDYYSANNAFSAMQDMKDFVSMKRGTRSCGRKVNIRNLKDGRTVVKVGLKYSRQFSAKQQKEELKEWENELNSKLFAAPSAKKRRLITVENECNDVEGCPLPTNFVYISDYEYVEGVERPDASFCCGCECGTGNCMRSNNKNCCPGIQEVEFPYIDRSSHLDIHPGRPIYECNRFCSCDETCRNRVVQKGQTKKLCIFRTDKCGWGLKAGENIARGTFISEYIGEVITSEEASLRGVKYDAEGRTYLLELDYCERDNGTYCVDSYKKGNHMRFANHSCEPNMILHPVWIEHHHPDLPRIAFFASKKIKKGEELTFDYAASHDEDQDENQEVTIDENAEDRGSSVSAHNASPCTKNTSPSAQNTSHSTQLSVDISALSPRKSETGSPRKQLMMLSLCHCGSKNCKKDPIFRRLAF